jgi:hypothetical protein
VRDIEHARLFTDGGVLGENGGILNRHGPTAKRDQAGAEGEVGGF